MYCEVIVPSVVMLSAMTRYPPVWRYGKYFCTALVGSVSLYKMSLNTIILQLWVREVSETVERGRRVCQRG